MSSTTKSQPTKHITLESVIGRSAALVVELSSILDNLGVTNHLTYSVGDVREFTNNNLTDVVLVGSNPSQKSPDNSPFHPDTKSRKFVDEWFKEGGYKIHYTNLVNKKTDNNKQLTKIQIGIEINNIFERYEGRTNIVACGKIATMGLTMAGIDHFEMPHPSGLCRFWNDKKAGEEKVKEMKEWLRASI